MCTKFASFQVCRLRADHAVRVIKRRNPRRLISLPKLILILLHRILLLSIRVIVVLLHPLRTLRSCSISTIAILSILISITLPLLILPLLLSMIVQPSRSMIRILILIRRSDMYLRPIKMARQRLSTILPSIYRSLIFKSPILIHILICSQSIVF